MSKLNLYEIPPEVVLGIEPTEHIPFTDQVRQRREVDEILNRLRSQPGVVLADEVGMGKTFVALGVAYSIAMLTKRGPVVVMAPANLIDKWAQDFKTFSELYLNNRAVVNRDHSNATALRARNTVRYGIARHSVELMKLLDDDARVRCHLIFLAQGAMGRRQTDKWIRLALIRETFRRHGRGRSKLNKIRRSIHRFMAQLLNAVGEESASGWGDALWQDLLSNDPTMWKEIYNHSVTSEKRKLHDDPVPMAVSSALSRGKLDLKPLVSALESMPLRESVLLSKRISAVRTALREVEADVWTSLLAVAKWRSPLLVMDEAHHLKNPRTSLARQLQSADTEQDMRIGDGALASAFDRMLFLTATPFQLGHQELVRVLQRFADVNWDKSMRLSREDLRAELQSLNNSLNSSQLSAIQLQKCWSRLAPDDGPRSEAVDEWWSRLMIATEEQLAPRQQALVDSFRRARELRSDAERELRSWIIRHNKPDTWPETQIFRRKRLCGSATNSASSGAIGIDIPPTQLLPFFLAARSAAVPGKDLLGEALCSSYEAFRLTRQRRTDDRDEYDEVVASDGAHADWYLSEFDTALGEATGRIHPKISHTVDRVVNLWEEGEKVLVFAFYRQTCRALRIHISGEIERRMFTLAKRRFAGAGRPLADGEYGRVIASIQGRYMDDSTSPARAALDRALNAIVSKRKKTMQEIGMTSEGTEALVDVMRRFLRVETTLVRSFPLHEHDTLEPHLAVRSMLDKQDSSRISWRDKFAAFLDFILDRCSQAERESYLQATSRLQTGRIRVRVGVDGDDADDDEAANEQSILTLANIQVATGQTKREQRARLMRAFNTPFFPDIFVCSEVMSEGVDLQRNCRHVIHHDLAWNPSQIEQRTGRIDRIGCKAEGEHHINIYLPFLAGASDERQFRVMTDREQWFRIVMGQDEVSKLIPKNSNDTRPLLPMAFTEELNFQLGIGLS